MTDATIVSVADLHIDHGRWGRLNPASGRSTAWESAHTCFLEACQYAIETQADGFVALGDLFLHGKPTAEAAEMVSEGFRRLDRAGIATVVLLGNHELLNIRAGHRHALLRFGDLTNVTVVDRPEVVTLPNGLQVACLPWPRKGEILADLGVSDLDPGEADDLVAGVLVEAIEDMADTINDSRPAIFAGHAAIGEATIGSDRRGSEMSIRSVFHEPILPVEAIARDPFKHCLLGHIHKRQTIGDRAHYVGSPDRIDFSEEHEPKGFTVLNVNDTSAEVTLVETTARELVTIDVARGDGFDRLNKAALVRVTLPEGETRLDPEIRDRIVETEAVIVQIRPTPRARGDRDRSTGTVAVSETLTPLEGFKLWAEREQITGDDLTRVTALAQQLFDDVEEPVGVGG